VQTVLLSITCKSQRFQYLVCSVTLDLHIGFARDGALASSQRLTSEIVSHAGKPVFGTLIALMYKGVPVRFNILSYR
jgi:hypothetical protein